MQMYTLLLPISSGGKMPGFGRSKSGPGRLVTRSCTIGHRTSSSNTEWLTCFNRLIIDRILFWLPVIYIMLYMYVCVSYVSMYVWDRERVFIKIKLAWATLYSFFLRYFFLLYNFIVRLIIQPDNLDAYYFSTYFWPCI